MFRKILVLSIISLFIGSIAMAEEKIINLPTPKTRSKTSIEQSIANRRSHREFLAKDLTMDQLSQILWAAQGITDKDFGFRAAPSAGALYPLNIYIAKKDGVFRYIADGHKLVQLSKEDKRPSLVRASLGQTFIKEAPVDIIISANFAITQAKYGARAFRYVCMEIGHVAENIHLQAVSLGLGSVPIGAFWDDVIKQNLDIPDNQDPLYIIPIGYVNEEA
ncbi:MAG: SagB/ThcOx family dehydrogenase [Candidatus Margulisbacteria bacterium]|nr:SagB/ThcOx family dehydrogenase [Candidatus Margulisiibacteriota bacterium]